MPRLIEHFDPLEQAAGRFEWARNESQEIISIINSLVKHLKSKWVDIENESFFYDYQNLNSIMKKEIDRLDQIANELRQLAVRFEIANNK